MSRSLRMRGVVAASAMVVGAMVAFGCESGRGPQDGEASLSDADGVERPEPSKSLPPLQDVAQMAGVELPDYLGKMVEEEKSPAPQKAVKAAAPEEKTDKKAGKPPMPDNE